MQADRAAGVSRGSQPQGASAKKIIAYLPVIVTAFLQDPLVKHTQVLVTIVLRSNGFIGKTACIEQAGLGPIQPEKPPGAQHLVLSVDLNGVVDKVCRQGIIPGRSGGVAVSSGVQGNIFAVPPQVDVKLVGMGRAALETAPRGGLPSYEGSPRR